jgi:hypothetical protein
VGLRHFGSFDSRLRRSPFDYAQGFWPSASGKNDDSLRRGGFAPARISAQSYAN